jgi:hypothetical protein
VAAETTFDLSSEAGADAARQLPGARAWAWVWSALGGLLVVVALYFAVEHSPSIWESIGVGIVLVVVGLGLAFLSWQRVQSIRDTPNHIVISDDFLEWRRPGRERGGRVRWNAPNLDLTLHDRQQIHDRLGSKDRRVVHTIIVNRQMRLPLSKPAYDAIVSRANQLGLSVKTHEFLGMAVTDIGPTRAVPAKRM